MSKIIGWCAYCKGKILENEFYVIEGSEIFHPFCKEQKNNYYDPFEDDLDIDKD